MSSTTEQDLLLESARDLLHRGCLSAGESLLGEARDGEDDEITILRGRIQALRAAANPQPRILLSPDALSFEMCKAFATAPGTFSREMCHMLLSPPEEESPSHPFNNRGFTALYVESANCFASIKRDSTRPMLLNNDRAAGWMEIRNGLRRCPFVSLWHGKFEWNDITVACPSLVQSARLLFDPRSQEEDARRARSILASLDRADEADKPTLRWWALFLCIDAEQWNSARDMALSVLRDCTASSSRADGAWPAYYLPEALYLAAVVEFGRNEKKSCAQYLKSYFDLAEPLDRNRADATLLRLWASKQIVPRPPTLQYLCLKTWREHGHDQTQDEDYLTLNNETERIVYDELPRLRESLSQTWNEHLFSQYTWVRIQVSKRLGMEEDNPYLKLKELLEAQWNTNQLLRRPKRVDDLCSRLEHSCGRTITIRHWELQRERQDSLWDDEYY